MHCRGAASDVAIVKVPVNGLRLGAVVWRVLYGGKCDEVGAEVKEGLARSHSKELAKRNRKE